MSAAKHTPGPWHTFSETFESATVVAEKMSIAIRRGLPVVHGVLAGRTEAEAEAAAVAAGADNDAGNIFVMMGNGPNSEANAALIAAAPDLLAALEAVVAWQADPNKDTPSWERRLHEARAALSKATGGAS